MSDGNLYNGGHHKTDPIDYGECRSCWNEVDEENFVEGSECRWYCSEPCRDHGEALQDVWYMAKHLHDMAQVAQSDPCKLAFVESFWKRLNGAMKDARESFAAKSS